MEDEVVEEEELEEVVVVEEEKEEVEEVVVVVDEEEVVVVVEEESFINDPGGGGGGGGGGESVKKKLESARWQSRPRSRGGRRMVFGREDGAVRVRPRISIRRGAYSPVDPAFQSSMAEVNLLFEVLLAGMQIDADGSVRIPDAELASLRSVRRLRAVCEDVLPKSLPEIRRLTAAIGQREGRGQEEGRGRGRGRRSTALSAPDFERTVLTMVYAAQVLANVSAPHQREVWGDALLQLFRAVKEDLT
ncbi:hypothetical protein CRUP_008163 [Coryphaenoides rupestris]|nr:hypothetical protein CRUP_008163 [Coryphaenoides rupestris]